MSTSNSPASSSNESALITFKGPYLRARFIKREKRFTVYAEALEGPLQGQTVKAHLADPGRLPHLMVEGRILWLTGPFPPPRKLSWSVTLAEVTPDCWVSLNTQLANKVVPELIARGHIKGLTGEGMRREVKRGDMRLDLFWEEEDGEHWGEIKTVSLVHPDGHASWPDAPSVRARKHISHLIEHAKAGQPASLIFLTYRGDVSWIEGEMSIDPKFCALLSEAFKVGVRVVGHRTRVTPEGVFNVGPVEVRDPGL